MRLAVYGGSFNPIHCGHLSVADEALSLGYDKLLFVPTFISPHKHLTASVSPSSRLAMLEAAISGNPKFEIEPCEIQRGGVSYTIDTIHFLLNKYRGRLDGKIGLVMGQEIASEFHKWKEVEQVAGFCDLIIASRQNVGDKRAATSVNKPRGNYVGGVDASGQFMGVDKSRFVWPYTELKNVIVPISSTEIRSRIAQGKSWRYLVPQAVYEYIVTNKLYGCKQ
ncbi:MAG: nicotinate (nicotinamide) nucleotide adenylyltransferase [Treponema sp.]|nr:nicotinate (nicotinamide) nucleotide adenylyltransferase [Treponema sp.]